MNRLAQGLLHVSADVSHGEFLPQFHEWESFLHDAAAVSERWCDSSTLAVFSHESSKCLKTKSIEWLNHEVGVSLRIVTVCDVTTASAGEL